MNTSKEREYFGLWGLTVPEIVDRRALEQCKEEIED
jgi:hypothetical protein